MIIPDINLLLYAYDSASALHSAAARWWSELLSHHEQVGLAHYVVFAFVRLATHARAFHHPMTAIEASGHVREWLAQPCVQLLDTGPRHVLEVLQVLETLGTAGNLVTDAQLAAIAMENQAVLHTTDSHFIRVPNLRWLNPLTGTGSRGIDPARRRSPKK